MARTTTGNHSIHQELAELAHDEPVAQPAPSAEGCSNTRHQNRCPWIACRTWLNDVNGQDS
jgi:hypothetical protein